MTTTTLSGPRWSSAVVCARAAVYQGLGIDGDPYSDATERRFGRGRRIGRVIADEIADTLTAQGRAANVEVECPWPRENPVGVGHADVTIPDESKVIEAVSTAGCALPEHKALQAVGYADSLGYENATVLSVDPHTGDERVYPLNIAELLPRVRAIQDAVVAGLNGGPLPDRMNGSPATPGAYPCDDCPFRRRCYDGWAPPPAGSLPDHADDFDRLGAIEIAIKKAGKEGKALEAERDEIRARLAPHLVDGMDYIEAGVRVRRTPVAGRRSLSFSAMEAAGWSLPPEAEPFVSEGKGFDRWTVSEVKS